MHLILDEPSLTMARMVPWASLFLAITCVYGLVMPRAGQGDVDLAMLIRDTEQVRGHRDNVLGALHKHLPYSEGPLKTSKLETVKNSGCFTMRRVVKPHSYQSTLDVVPTFDLPYDTVTGVYEESVTITSSTAKIDTARLGWNKEKSSETGGSVKAGVSAGASAGLGFFESHMTTTVYENESWTEDKTGKKAMQSEFRTELTETKKCPPHSICRAVTWTYTRTISGTCYILPLLDTRCAMPDSEMARFGNTSLGLYPDCSPISDIASQFFEFSSPRAAPGFGPDLQGVKMHRPEAVSRNIFEAPCSFSHPLRWGNGNLVKAQAFVSFPIVTGAQLPTPLQAITSADGVNSTPVNQQIPNAVEWVEKEKGKAYCKLQKGWSWLPPNNFYIPKKQDGTDDYAAQPSWPKPQGIDEKCPQYKSWGNLSGRADAKADEESPAPNGTVGDATEQETSAAKSLHVEMILDDMPRYISLLQDASFDGMTPALQSRDLILGWHADVLAKVFSAFQKSSDAMENQNKLRKYRQKVKEQKRKKQKENDKPRERHEKDSESVDQCLSALSG